MQLLAELGAQKDGETKDRFGRPNQRMGCTPFFGAAPANLGARKREKPYNLLITLNPHPLPPPQPQPEQEQELGQTPTTGPGQQQHKYGRALLLLLLLQIIIDQLGEKKRDSQSQRGTNNRLHREYFNTTTIVSEY